MATSISGGEKLIDATLKTSVTEKTFTQELDQEAKELAGKITITVSGISYSETDVVALFTDRVSSQLMPGYAFDNNSTDIEVKGVQVKKDGTTTVTTHVRGSALPSLDSDAIRKGVAGKSVTKAQEYLKTTGGVAGAEFRFRWAVFPNRLPINRNNISVTISAQKI
ncbi:MAG: hypothetical protein ACD_36C00135G0001 [uncultured bacterium]|nr:MAG: hypothetical protein ACD_36C00135G0001 [uncultured bacterium]